MTGEPTTAADLRRAIQENAAEPEGAARNARAERIAEEADRTGDRPLIIEALFNLLTAYNYSSESDKRFVPFAKALRMWDEQPGDFDEFSAKSLHWYFKWVSSGMLDQPHIPLAAIEKWQAEMEHRYRLAGYSERAVRQGQFRIARHIGDLPRAEAAFAAWLAADRDVMSDCHACELHAQGGWRVRLGDDRRALESWQPVLAGELTCAHEPHGVLASSLLPLLRTGSADLARANHLRGYRMVRSMESMRSAVAQHIEFCALTGNEARGLEILAAHPAHFTAAGDPDSLMDHHAVTALLTARLTALGHADRPVPGPAGRDWTAADLHTHARTRALELAHSFDARNGTRAVSEAVRERMARQPLLERLPLGIRAARLGEAAATEAGPALPPPRADSAPAEPGADDLPDMVAEARRLSGGGDPRAHQAWADVAAAVERTGAEVDAAARAEITDNAAMAAIGEPVRSRELFLRAARQFEDAREPGEAAASRARAAYALALTGEADEALRAVEEQCAVLRDLHGGERATARQVSGAGLLRCRVLLAAAAGGDDEARRAALAEAAQQAADVAEFSDEHQAEPGMTGRLADATVMLGRLAAGRGDGERAVRLLTRGAELHHAAEQPWYAAEPEAALADLTLRGGDPETAADCARAALDHGADVLEPPHRAHLHLLIAQARAALGDDEQAAAEALEAATWADEAGHGDDMGATARLLFGGALRRLGRAEEGACVLESVLPDLERGGNEAQIVQARWWLAECQLDLGEAREAAEQFLRAARVAEGWDDPCDHAMLANLAADALNRAGLHDEAVRAYARAEDLWRAVGDPHALIRTLRARAWIEVGEGRGGITVARSLMTAAADTVRQALEAADPDDGTATGHLRVDLADTYRQTAEIVLRAAGGTDGSDDGPGDTDAVHEEALALADLAIATLTPLGAAARDDRTAATLMAAWLEADLARPTAAATRARTVTAEYADAQGPTADARRAEAASILDYTSADRADDES
ncbi:tetratricopeptide repeat protein [Streptomyces sp. NPDC087422]|uniref:tetratricopeptide repeat protein n=1 Tax=Streptomyces sp. NPDC087422 TaxID=3365786 RepID=UPI00382FC343